MKWLVASLGVVDLCIFDVDLMTCLLLYLIFGETTQANPRSKTNLYIFLNSKLNQIKRRYSSVLPKYFSMGKTPFCRNILVYLQFNLRFHSPNLQSYLNFDVL